MIQATPRMPTAARRIETGTATPAPLPVNEAPAMVEMKKADANTGPMKPIDWAITSRSVSCPRPRVSNSGSAPMRTSSFGWHNDTPTRTARAAGARVRRRRPGSCGGRCPGAADGLQQLVAEYGAQERQHVVGLRVAAQHLLREDEVVVDVHVEHPAAARHQHQLAQHGAPALRDPRRQTGGVRGRASGDAVG